MDCPREHDPAHLSTSTCVGCARVWPGAGVTRSPRLRRVGRGRHAVDSEASHAPCICCAEHAASPASPGASSTSSSGTSIGDMSL